MPMISDTVGISSVRGGEDVKVTGPNGFLRRFTGGSAGANQEVTATYAVTEGNLFLDLVNSAHTACTFTVVDNSYGEPPRTFKVAAGMTSRQDGCLSGSHGWYDITVTCSADPAFLRRLAGHVETGWPSRSDPTFSSGG
jgi:phospholipase C